MAIVTEEVSVGRAVVRTYSDQGFYIEREDGHRFAEAYDVEGAGHSYTETGEELPTPDVEGLMEDVG